MARGCDHHHPAFAVALGDGMTLEQKRKIAELVPYPIRPICGDSLHEFIVDGQENWPLIGAIVEECERRGWYWKLNPRMAQVWFNKGTGEYKQKYVTDCTKTEAFCLAFLAAVEAVA